MATSSARYRSNAMPDLLPSSLSIPLGGSAGAVVHPDRGLQAEEPDPHPVPHAQGPRDHRVGEPRVQQHHPAARTRHPGQLPEHRPQPAVQVPLDAVPLPEGQIGHARPDAVVGHLQAAGVTHANVGARGVPPGGSHRLGIDVQAPGPPAGRQRGGPAGRRGNPRPRTAPPHTRSPTPRPGPGPRPATWADPAGPPWPPVAAARSAGRNAPAGPWRSPGTSSPPTTAGPPRPRPTAPAGHAPAATPGPRSSRAGPRRTGASGRPRRTRPRRARGRRPPTGSRVPPRTAPHRTARRTPNPAPRHREGGPVPGRPSAPALAPRSRTSESCRCPVSARPRSADLGEPSLQLRQRPDGGVDLVAQLGHEAGTVLLGLVKRLDVELVVL